MIYYDIIRTRLMANANMIFSTFLSCVMHKWFEREKESCYGDIPPGIILKLFVVNANVFSVRQKLVKYRRKINTTTRQREELRIRTRSQKVGSVFSLTSDPKRAVAINIFLYMYWTNLNTVRNSQPGPATLIQSMGSQIQQTKMNF